MPQVPPPTITCAMEPDWRRWYDGTEAKVRAVWDKTLEEAWVTAQAIGRLNNAIRLLERTESRNQSHVVGDTKDLPVSASDCEG